MTHETRELAQYAARCRYSDFPADVVERAKQCIADTISVIMFGAHLPWSRIITAYAEKNGAGGKSHILGGSALPVHAPAAALANGALAHAFEMDNLTWPSTGVHPGATLFAAGLAVAQERGKSGRELIEAFVAGGEVMIRIGLATRHSNEGRGFHAPGTTGPFGAAVTCGKLMNLDPERMGNALGIAGSLACGLMEFARSGTGAMVKRLHLGRAAESGVLSAGLAGDGFTGPVSILEGEFGFLRVFCGADFDAAQLTCDLGTNYATRMIMLKRFACHITAHTPVQAILELRSDHGYEGSDVASIRIEGNDKMATVNNIRAPGDIMMAQYSIPFCVALAHYRDPRDPSSFDDEALCDPHVRALAERTTISVAPDRPTPLAARVTVTLKDGRVFSRVVADFPGTPQRPLSGTELREKFLLLTRPYNSAKMATMFERLDNLENESDLGWLATPKALQ
jgi:2-methylcitrate dehydratase PrpD